MGVYSAATSPDPELQRDSRSTLASPPADSADPLPSPPTPPLNPPVSLDVGAGVNRAPKSPHWRVNESKHSNKIGA
jgi:hypothetical protein